MTTHDVFFFRQTVLQTQGSRLCSSVDAVASGIDLESQRRQIELVDVARRRGFTNVEIIDDDLGRSASWCGRPAGFRPIGRRSVRRAGRRCSLSRCLVARSQWT